jgi:hypothetical protein
MRTEVPRRPNPNLALHPGINFSCLRVEGDLGGLIFAAGSVIALVAGVPVFRPFFFGALGGGLLLAGALAFWHERHPDPPGWRPIGLNLAGRDPEDGFGREQPRPRLGGARLGRPATLGA